MADITVTRRYIRNDYFETLSGGYANPINGGAEGAARHWEVGELAYVTGDSKNIIHFFQDPFQADPFKVNFEVFRWRQESQYVFVKEEVVFYYPTQYEATAYGFVIVIEDYEDINGVIIKFAFTG